MKKTITTFSILVLSFPILFAQQINVYGLFYEQTGEFGNTQLVSLDNTTGDMISLGLISGLMAISVGSSTFDQFNNRYIFWGISNSYQQKIYHIDIADAFTANSISFGNSPPGELEYDLQYDKVYGFWNSQLLEVDIFSGVMTTVGTYGSITGYALGSSTFDSNISHYIIVGVGSNGSKTLYTIDVNTGAVVYSSNLGSIGMSALHFDVQSNTLYGLYPIADGSTYWVSINQQTGEITYISLVPELSTMTSGIVVGSSTYSQNTQSMVFIGVNGSQKQLFTLDALTGTITQDVPFENQVIELEVNNTSFANNFYNKLSNTTSVNAKNITVTPNPATNLLNVNLPNNQPIQLLDTSGKLIRTFENHQGQLNISTLSSGAYWLVAKEGNTILKSLFIKE